MSPRLALEPMLFDLPRGDTTIGSGAQAGWRIQGKDLMARHFVVTVRDGEATLRAASPDAVVSVDGDQIVGDARPLADGSLIAAGSACFTYWADVPKTLSTEPRPPRPPAFLLDVAANTAYPLTRTSTTIGRDPSNFVVLPDATVSRFHAEIRREAGGYALHTMGSSGTKLNGEPLPSPRLLREADEIEIAGSKLRFTEERPRGMQVRAEAASTVDPSLASRDTIQSRRISLSVKAPSRPPRNLSLLLVSAIVLLGLVLALFWILR